MVAGKGGGKRAGAGRKAGEAWQSQRPARAVARQNVARIMESGQDPILGVMEIAENRELDPDTRLRAYAIALPYCRPRLSAQVTIDATPKGGAQDVDQAALLARMMGMLDRLSTSSKPAPVTIDVNAVDEA